MINIMTVHWQSAKWIDIQANYLRRNIDVPYRVFASLNGIDDPGMRDRFYFSADLEGSHAQKLNELADIVIAQSDPSDVLMFLDGDAFPIAPLGAWIPDVLRSYRLVAVRRDENLGDPQPHPCFCITTAALWQEVGGDWSRGGTWVNSVGKVCADVGGTLLHQLRDRGIEWLPLLRTNTYDRHPVFFGVYDHRIYHHGAGFREMQNRAENARWAAFQPTSEQPSLGMLRMKVAHEPGKLLRIRPRHARVAGRAVLTSIPLERAKLEGKLLDRYQRRLVTRLTRDPEFYRAFDGMV
jgi:hypothetical protein